jgi:hypothetical protein
MKALHLLAPTLLVCRQRVRLLEDGEVWAGEPDVHQALLLLISPWVPVLALCLVQLQARLLPEAQAPHLWLAMLV